MSPVYLNPHQHSSSISFLDFKGDHRQQHSLPMFDYSHDHVTITNNTYFSCSNPENRHTSNDFLAIDYSKDAQKKGVDQFSDLGQVLQSSTNYGYTTDGSGCSYAYPYDQADTKPEIINSDQKPKKCKPTKLRILQTGKSTKIRGENKHVQRSNSNHHFNQPSLRMCSDCHTTTTPLWRSGPQGPKSLCNACGIRQRKAKRAAMAAATTAKYEAETSSMSSTTTTITTTTTTTKTIEAPRVIVDQSHTLPLKKRCKPSITDWNSNNNNNNTMTSAITTNNNDCHKGKNPCLYDFELSSSSSKIYSASERVFPRDDEEEGALLLMALSSGLASSS